MNVPFCNESVVPSPKSQYQDIIGLPWQLSGGLFDHVEFSFIVVKSPSQTISEEKDGSGRLQTIIV